MPAIRLTHAQKENLLRDVNELFSVRQYDTNIDIAKFYVDIFSEIAPEVHTVLTNDVIETLRQIRFVSSGSVITMHAIAPSGNQLVQALDITEQDFGFQYFPPRTPYYPLNNYSSIILQTKDYKGNIPIPYYTCPLTIEYFISKFPETVQDLRDILILSIRNDLARDMVKLIIIECSTIQQIHQILPSIRAVDAAKGAHTTHLDKVQRAGRIPDTLRNNTFLIANSAAIDTLLLQKVLIGKRSDVSVSYVEFVESVNFQFHIDSTGIVKN